MIFAVVSEKLICTKPTMPFMRGNVLQCCFHYGMFEYRSCPICSIHVKRYLLSMRDLYLFQMHPLAEFIVLVAVKVLDHIFP